MRKMKTTKEIQNSVIKRLENLPVVVDNDSPDVVQVNNKYYVKKITKVFLNGGSYTFNESMSFTGLDVNNPPTYTFDFTSNETSYTKLGTFYRGYWGITYGDDSSSRTAYSGSWSNKNFREIVVDEAITDEALLAFLGANASYSEPAYRYDYEYVEVAANVEDIPTDVNIVEDEGAWQIQLEHDSDVLSVVDITPYTEFVQAPYFELGEALTEVQINIPEGESSGLVNIGLGSLGIDPEEWKDQYYIISYSGSYAGHKYTIQETFGPFPIPSLGTRGKWYPYGSDGRGTLISTYYAGGTLLRIKKTESSEETPTFNTYTLHKVVRS